MTTLEQYLVTALPQTVEVALANPDSEDAIRNLFAHLKIADSADARNVMSSLIKRASVSGTVRVAELETAIRLHRDQRADDRCWLDDLALYAVLGGDVPADNRVGDKFAMAQNCMRFIDRRCEGEGQPPPYADLEAANARLRLAIEDVLPYIDTPHVRATLHLALEVAAQETPS